MSMGGDFYAVTDDQLNHLLSGKLDYGDFFYDVGIEQPHECLSAYEHLWFELTQVLALEQACGVEQTDAIPEASGYASASDVPAIAQALAHLDFDTVQARCEELDIESGGDAMWLAVQDIAAFYQRAAHHGDAVIFRVT